MHRREPEPATVVKPARPGARSRSVDRNIGPNLPMLAPQGCQRGAFLVRQTRAIRVGRVREPPVRGISGSIDGVNRQNEDEIFMTRAMRASIAGRLLTAVAAATVVVATSFGAVAADGDVLARVNGKDITKNEVDLAMDVFGEQLQQVPEGARRAMVVDALVDMHVMADAAAAAGLENDPKFKDRMSFLKAQALRNTYIEESVQKSITEDELKARYQKDVAGYAPPEEVHARHILVKTEDEANQIIKDLAAGKDFAEIAKEKSQDPGSKDNGGDLGFFAKGQMVPPFEEEAFRLKAGEISTKPVKTDFGYHVLKVEEKRTQPVPTFEEVRAQVEQVLQREKFQEVLGKLKGEAKIERLDQAAAAPAPADGAAPAPAPAQ